MYCESIYMVKISLQMTTQTLLASHLFGFFLLIGQSIMYCLQTPTYMSEWKVIKSQHSSLSELFFEHSLGEIPIKVVTEVKVNSSGKDYIFHAMGSAHRDDDSNAAYGGIVYMYNNVEVRVFAPNKRNGKTTGLAMYTGNSKSWTGPFNEMFQMAYVRVKAWKRDDLPNPDFESSWIDLDVTNNLLIQQEFEHGLGDFPSMVVVQVKGLEDYISEADGMSTLLNRGKNVAMGGALYGYSNETIRIWIPGQFPIVENKNIQAGIMSVGDGWGKNEITVAHKGSCKIYAWKFRPDPAFTFLENGDVDTTVEMNFSKTIELANALIMAEVQPNDGVNSGFRFRAAASAMNDGISQPYGGLFYAYNSQEFVMWKPHVSSINKNGAILNIGGMWGGGKYSQRTNNVTIRLRVWNLIPEDQVRCWLKGIRTEENYQFNIGVYYNQTAKFDCLPNYTYMKGSRYRTCQRNGTWSGSKLKCQAPKLPTVKRELVEKLRVPMKETSKYKRSLTCAQDNRTSAIIVGVVTTSAFSIPAILFIGSEVGCIILSCLHSVIRLYWRKR